MNVIKASGESERFDPKKIFRTCIRAGASRELAKEVVDEVSRTVYDGITTREIFRLTLSLLKKKPDVAARYNLKRAIMMLGPTGFPFERFFARVLNNYGYRTFVGRIVQGRYVRHEVDIIASKESVYMIECKYHNAPGIYTDLKVALYTYARFLDLEKEFDRAWLVCNTKCSANAILYAKGVDLKLTSWRYPKEDSLERMIEQKRLYPITILRSMNRQIRDRFAAAGIVLAGELLDSNMYSLKRKTGLQEKVLGRVIEEAKRICLC